MQVGIRSLLTVALAIGAVACTVNDKGLGTGDAGASNTGHAGTGAPSPGAAGMSGAAGGSPTGTGLAGSTGGSSPTGAAGNGTAGTGAAGDLSGGAGTNGAAGVTGNAGMSGGAGSTGDAGVAGTAGAGGTTAGSGGAGIGSSGGAGSSATGGKGGAGAAGVGAAGAFGTPGEIGCSDGTREGYLDRVKYPRIAACDGAWDDPGLASLDSRAPQCDRRAGNDGDKPDGSGCSVADLCASGWSVCNTAHEVATNAPTGCADATAPYGDNPVFFVTRQRGTGLVCDVNNQMGANNLYGCGTIGSPADKSCAPFKTMLRDSDCAMNWPWVCAEGPIGTSQNEYGVVTKAAPGKGGVLCCKN